MRKQTDLAKVKQTALALLSTEINETPYSPMIVKHPFTDTGVSAIPDGKGGVDMIDLTEDDAQLKWRQSMARQIDKADNAYAIYMMVTKPYALTFLKFAMPHLSREDMSQILASAWTRSEAPHQDVNVTGAICPVYYYTDIFMCSSSLENFFTTPLGFKYFMYASVKQLKQIV